MSRWFITYLHAVRVHRDPAFVPQYQVMDDGTIFDWPRLLDESPADFAAWRAAHPAMASLATWDQLVEQGNMRLVPPDEQILPVYFNAPTQHRLLGFNEITGE